ncbi:MAG: helix-turn-helix transcriptional regulator [Actinomycetota bacterium]
MAETPGRLLKLLSMLQARPTWTGPDLAERLGITPRTVRRDVDRLRRLGYPVNAVSGPAGGYELGVGCVMPPLLLDDDEAVAVAVGLRSAADGSITGLEEATVSALAKLDQVLPRHLAGRVADLHATTVQLWGRQPEPVDASALAIVARACRRSERLRFSYTARTSERTDRLVEPYRLVRFGVRWYLVAHDVGRADWRTFRLDRLSDPRPTGTRFELIDPPDPGELVTRGLAVGAYDFVARIRLPLPLDEALRVIPRSVGVPAADGSSTIFELGGDARSMPRWLASLPCPCEVLDPPELREALRRHAEAVAAANAGRLGAPS